MKEYQAPLTLAETLYQQLKKAIAEGDLKPGQRLHEKEIAEKFKVSVTPVREAFLRLAAEKYLISDARHEILVNRHTIAEAMDLYEIIRILDLHATKKVLKTLTTEQISRLKEMTEELGAFYQTKNLQGYLEQNLKIHDAIWQACENKALYETLTQTLEKVAVFRKYNNFMLFPDHHSLDKSYQYHLKLIELLEHKNETELESLIRTHWGEDLAGNKD
jgi:DNA-binding GntR family transcriptional regulator